MGENNDNEKESVKPASEMDDESLFDRLFPNELVEWVRNKFGEDNEDEENE